MKDIDSHRVKVVIVCTRTGKESEIHCLSINRSVPPELRCAPSVSGGGGGGGESDVELWSCQECKTLGRDLVKLRQLVKRELRDNLQQVKRQGAVEIPCS